jgi:hypothetical protein
MLVEADMARSLDSLGWTKVGVCSCVVCMQEGCASAREGAVGNRIYDLLVRPPLLLPLSASSLS